MSDDKAIGKQGEISTELGRLNGIKEQLHNRIEVLFDRLQELLSPPGPTTESCSKKEPLQSKFASDLSSISTTIEADLEKVNSIIDRLEL